jgi:hypothetical protein
VIFPMFKTSVWLSFGDARNIVYIFLQSILLYKVSKNWSVYFCHGIFLLYPFYPSIRRIIFIFS